MAAAAAPAGRWHRRWPGGVLTGSGWQGRTGRPDAVVVLTVAVMVVAAAVFLASGALVGLVYLAVAAVVSYVSWRARSNGLALIEEFGPPPAGRGRNVSVGSITGWHSWLQAVLDNKRAGLGEPTYEVRLLAGSGGARGAEHTMGSGLDRVRARELTDRLTVGAPGWSRVVMVTDSGCDRGRVAITRRVAGSA